MSDKSAPQAALVAAIVGKFASVEGAPMTLALFDRSRETE